jgi:WD40 repeat protein
LFSRNGKGMGCQTGQLCHQAGFQNPSPDVAFSPDGTRIAAASHDQTARIWDAETGKELLTLSGHTSGVLVVAFSPDGQRLVTGSSDGTAKVWDALTGQLLETLPGGLGEVWGVAFSPDDGGAHLIVASVTELYA